MHNGLSGSFVQWIVWAIAMSLTMRWIARSRYKRHAVSEAHRLVHSHSTFVVGLLGFCFFLGLAIISNIYKNPTVTIWTTLAFVGFSLLFLAVVYAYFRDWHLVSDEGMSYARFLRRRGTLKWSDVTRVRYSARLNWFSIRTKAGAAAHVSNILNGLPEFAELVLAHVSPVAIGPKTRHILEATAAGELPPIGSWSR
jgi:hypothetical protein